MKLSKLIFSFLGILFFYSSLFSQENTVSSGPTYINTANFMTVMPSIASRSNLVLADTSLKEIQDSRSSRNTVVPGKGLPFGDDVLAKDQNNQPLKMVGKTPSIVFDGAQSSSQPTDPAGAVGPNHYVLVFNTGFRIFDKNGTPLTDQLNTNNIFPSSGCCDLTVSYDIAAERFVMTLLGSSVQVAVSQTSDPLNDGWHVFDFPMSTDYQKLSIWSDGYYLTANKDSNSAGTSEVIHALEREKMLSGDATAQIIGFPLPGISTSGFYSPQAFNVTSSNLPASGNVPIVYMQDDAWDGVTEDHLKLWSVTVDWVTPANSTISTAQTIPTTAFTSVFDGGSFVNLAQPGGTGGNLDALQATIMNQAQFRKFDSYNSAVFNFVVDIDGTAEKLAGVRWYELRQTNDGEPWSIYQEGTYVAPDNKHAWNASMGIDVLGNIGMGYTGMGGDNNLFLSSYYTGRYANDPLNTMTITEELIAAGGGDMPGTRYGDYSKVALDPVDDKTFWFANEYYKSQRLDVVGVFKIAPNFANDIGVVSINNPVDGTLTDSEAISITIFNYGENEATNFSVSYQVEGGSLVTETYTGTIASAETASFTFSNTADLSNVGQTYEITALTNMSGDEDDTNDSITKTVIHLYPNDIGVIAVTAPVSGTDLTSAENITVLIENFGGESQSDFDISYNLDGTIIDEMFVGELLPNTTESYTFSQTGDFAAFGLYSLSAYTSLAGDSNTDNDLNSVEITKSNCEPTANCTLGDGIRLFQLGSIDNSSDCGTDGYTDFTSMMTDLAVDSTNDLTITTGYGNQFITVWIDFNDDFVFTNDERVITNFEIADGSGAGTFTETMSLVIPADASLGEHLMRAKTNWNAEVPDDPCEETTYGETEDYKVNIMETLGLENLVLGSNQLLIKEIETNIFEISFLTDAYINRLNLTVYNVMGQKMVNHRLDNANGVYSYILDMNYVPVGVYLVRLGTNDIGKVSRLIVK